MRDAVLKRYFFKCKRKYDQAFFEWRRIRRRVKVKRCVELICNLRIKDQYITESMKQKLLTFGVDGLAQIEDKRLKYYNFKPIDKLSELEVRGMIRTTYEEPLPKLKGADQGSSVKN